MKKKIIFIDQNFKDLRGHHYHVNKILYENLKKNFDTIFFTNKNIKPEIKKNFKKNIRPFFEKDNYKSKSYQIIFKKLSYFSYRVLKKIYFLLPNDIVKYFLKCTPAFFFNLLIRFFFGNKKYNYQYNLSKIDQKYDNAILYIQSLNDFEISELLNYVYVHKYTKNKIVLNFNRDPELLNHYDFIIKYLIKYRNFSITTDSESTKKYFDEKGIYSTATGILSENLFHLKQDKKKLEFQEGKLKISYIGEARYEKGFFNLPKLIKQSTQINKFQFFVQCNNNGYDVLKWKKTIKTLSNFKNIRLIDRVLTQNEYKSLLLSSDVVLLPYLSEYYRYRNSGIFDEAIFLNKIPLPAENTHLSNYYKDNIILDNLIITETSSLKKQLYYVLKSKKKILKEIKKVKKEIIKSNHVSKSINFFKKLSRTKSKKNNFIIQTPRNKIDFYSTYSDLLQKKADGSQNNIKICIEYILSALKNKNFTAKIFLNQKINSDQYLLILQKLKKLFFSSNFDLKIINMISFFKLKSNILDFTMFFNRSEIKHADVAILTRSFYSKIITQFNKKFNTKVIIMVHDVYTNDQSKYLIDHKNNHFIFNSYNDYIAAKFKSSKKYLIIPYIKCQNCKYDFVKKLEFKKINFFFISSGADHDIKNLKILIKLFSNQIKINVVGEICKKKEFTDIKIKNVKLLGFINNIHDIFDNKNNIILVPRFFGSGIPIKFTEALSHSSRILLMGDIEKFGLPAELLKNIHYAKNNKKKIKEFILNIKYNYEYAKIINFLNKKLKENLNKLKKEFYLS